MRRGIGLKPQEIRTALEQEGVRYPPVLNVEQVAALLGRSKKTIDAWIARGHLDGSFRKRGKRNMFWRDRVIDLIFNGREWS